MARSFGVGGGRTTFHEKRSVLRIDREGVVGLGGINRKGEVEVRRNI